MRFTESTEIQTVSAENETAFNEYFEYAQTLPPSS